MIARRIALAACCRPDDESSVSKSSAAVSWYTALPTYDMGKLRCRRASDGMKIRPMVEAGMDCVRRLRMRSRLRQVRAQSASCVDIGRASRGAASALSCARLAAERWTRTGISGDVAEKGCSGVGSGDGGRGDMYAGWSDMLKGIELVMLRKVLRSRPSFVVAVIWRASTFRCCCANRVSSLKMRISSFVALPSATECDIANVRIVPPAMALNCTLQAAKGRSLPRFCGTGTRRS